MTDATKRRQEFLDVFEYEHGPGPTIWSVIAGHESAGEPYHRGTAAAAALMPAAERALTISMVIRRVSIH